MGLASKKEAEMKPTPRNARLGAIADALMAARDFSDKAKVPDVVPLIGGQGLGSLVLGKAPEELTEMSYGNMPMRINPLAGRTASYVPEMKPGRKEQVADLALLAGTPKVGKVGLGLAGGVDDVERAALAFHGTPHRFAPEPDLPLGRFRAEKIGSGEGQQMYGYGLYFAELPNVAGRYKADLSLDKGVFDLVDKKTNEIIPENTSGFSLVKEQMKSYGRDLKDSDIQTFKDRWQGTRKIYNERLNELSELNKKHAGDKKLLQIISDMRVDYIDKIKELENASLLIDKVKRKPAGSLYTVDIPDEMVGKMLDFDAPLSEQPENIQKILRTLAEQDAKKYGEGGGLDYYAQDPDSYSGESLYNYLAEQEGGQKQASTFLQSQGIPGVRYFDEYSRAQGEGTRNIVVFPGEESKVKILKRNEDETKMAKGGMMKPRIPGFQDGGNANEAPIGALPKEVADDVPAQLSEGEFVVPADVVRFIGLERLMKMRDEAKEGLRRMAEIGQMGNAEAVGEKADDSFEDDSQFESTIDDIMSEVDADEQTQQAFAQGGAVGGPPWLTGYDMKKAPKNPVFDVRYFKHSDGRMMYVTFYNGKPMTPIPDGFTEVEGPVEQQVGKEDEEKKKATPAPSASEGGDGGDATGPSGATVGQGVNTNAASLGLSMMGVPAFGLTGLAINALGSAIAGQQADAMGEAADALSDISNNAVPGVVAVSDQHGNIIGFSSPATIAASDAATFGPDAQDIAAAEEAGVTIGGQPGMEGISDVGGPGVSADADSGVGPGVGDAVSGVTGDDGVGVYAKGGMVQRRKQPAKKQKKKGLASR